MEKAPPGDGILSLELPDGLTIAYVPVESLQLLEKNARVMRRGTYMTLVENLRQDGRLESVPLCRPNSDGTYKVLSGNHRVMAAKDAGVERIPILILPEDLSRAEEVAKQLSHNAIVGEDDPGILRELWEEVDDVDLKRYSGLDDAALNALAQFDAPGLTDIPLDFHVVAFVFLPEKMAQKRALLERLAKELTTDAILLRWSEHDRLLNALSEIMTRHTVRNSATAMMLLLDAVEEALSAGSIESDAPADQAGEGDASAPRRSKKAEVPRDG